MHTHDRQKPAGRQATPPIRVATKGPQFGHVFIEGQSAGIPCTVASLTAEGAVIAAPGWLGMPDRFSLQLRQSGGHFRCRVVSRRGGSAKVSFEAAPERVAAVAKP